MCVINTGSVGRRPQGGRERAWPALPPV